jgi:hypothetical protein
MEDYIPNVLFCERLLKIQTMIGQLGGSACTTKHSGTKEHARVLLLPGEKVWTMSGLLPNQERIPSFSSFHLSNSLAKSLLPATSLG